MTAGFSLDGSLDKNENMPAAIYYRDPHNPGRIYGPFTIEQLPELVDQARLRAADEVSFDQQAWSRAAHMKPDLFPQSSTDWYAAQPAWKRTAIRVLREVKATAIAAWNYVRAAALFYWGQRKELRHLATEYLTFLKEPGTRKEIRIKASEQNEAVSFDGTQWRADLPNCCVVCGELTDCDCNREQRSIADLTWPFLLPFLGLLFGIVCWLFVFDVGGRWMILVGLLAGFLVGYALRRETLVTVSFRRCREHLNRTRIPWIRIFRSTLIIGVGDRSVWRRFYHGDRDFESPIAAPVPPDFTQQGEQEQAAPQPHDSGSSYPTIPLVDDSEMHRDEGPAHSAF